MRGRWRRAGKMGKKRKRNMKKGREVKKEN